MQVIDPFEFLSANAGAMLTTAFGIDEHNDLRATARQKPVRCDVSTLGVATQAEIINRQQGACFFFHTRLGKLPFTAQAPEARQLVLDILRKLRTDTNMMATDLNINLNSQGEVHLRGSLITEQRPTISTFITALAEYVQTARPFLLELKPLLH